MAERAGITYKRLPGKGPRKSGPFFSIFSRCRLYLAKDHVLAVDSSGFSEDYKRFYFADIQAIITRRTPRWIVWSLLLFLMALASLGIGLLVRMEPLRIFWWLLTAAFVAFLVVNLLKGPTCACRILTAVQEDMLPSLTRVRVARKVLDHILRPLIEAAQGRLQPGELAAAETAGRVTQRRDDSSRTAAKGPGMHAHAGYRGIVHIIAFSLFVVGGTLTGIDILHHSVVTLVILNMVNTGGMVCLVVALVKQHGSMLSGGVRAVAWANFAFFLLSCMLSYGLGFALMVQTRVPMTNQWDMSRAMLRLSPLGSPVAMAIFCVEAAGAFIIGGLGLALALKDKRARAVPVDPHLIEEVVYKA